MHLQIEKCEKIFTEVWKVLITQPKPLEKEDNVSFGVNLAPISSA